MAPQPLSENTQYASVGNTRKPNSNADSSANVLVKANGWNILPSCACMANTGMKLTTVVAMAVRMADDTSLTPS